MNLHRQLLDWEWFDNSHMVHIWVYFLLKANVKDEKWRGIDIPRGSFVTSLDTICKDTGLSLQNVRTCLRRLILTSKVTSKVTNKYTIISICEYDIYADNFVCTNKQTNKQPNKQSANESEKSQLNNITTTKAEYNNVNDEEKKKKEKNIKKEKDEKFEECWTAYNRKGSKAKSLEYWKKLSENEKSLVLPHIKVYVSSREKCYQKDFERYLRDKIFLNVVVKGNTTIYDPERFTNEEYRPLTDGLFQIWDEERKCLLFNGYIDQLNDGYTSDTRPDGAKVSWNMYVWIWSSQKKEWVKQ